MTGLFNKILTRPDLVGEVLKHLFFDGENLRPEVKKTNCVQQAGHRWETGILDVDGAGNVVVWFGDKEPMVFILEDGTHVLQKNNNWFYTNNKLNYDEYPDFKEAKSEPPDDFPDDLVNLWEDELSPFLDEWRF